MSHRDFPQSGRLALLVATVVALALLVPAVALAVGTPTVTIVGPGLTPTPTPTGSPTAAALAVHESVRRSLSAGQRLGSRSGEVLQRWRRHLERPSRLEPVSVLGPLLRSRRDAVPGRYTHAHGAVLQRRWRDLGGHRDATTLVDPQPPEVPAPDGYWNNHYPYKLSTHDQIGLSGVQNLWYRVDAGALTKVTAQAPLFTPTRSPRRSRSRGDRDAALHRLRRAGLRRERQRS